jgi:choline dehydrogenase-like flavoprotein
VNPAGIGNDRDLVGRHFCEHLILPAGFAALARPPADASLYRIADLPVSPDPDRLIGVRGIFTLTAEAIRDNQILDWEAQLEIGTVPAGAPAQPSGVRLADVDPLLEQVEGLPAQTVMYVQLTGEQIPRPENQVVLSDTTDALGQRRADLRWTIAPEERASLVRGLELLSQRLGQAGLGRLQYAPGGMGYNPDAPEGGENTTIYEIRPDEIDLEAFPVGVGFHHLCTLRMAEDPAQGVVDADAKVHSVDNLWAAGSSVFPNAGASTPTMTIVALSLRLADHLRTQVLR